MKTEGISTLNGDQSIQEATKMYRFLKAFGTPVLRVFFRLRCEGIENIPASGPFILAANHVSYLDPFVLGATCPRPIHYIMLRHFWEKPLVGWVCRKAGSFPVDLERSATGSLRRAITILKEGKVLGIFPEGGRSSDGQILPGKGGAVLLALKTGRPLVPAAIIGAERALPKGSVIPRPFGITVRYGRPLTFTPPVSVTRRKEFLRITTEKTMEEINALARL